MTESILLDDAEEQDINRKTDQKLDFLLFDLKRCLCTELDLEDILRSKKVLDRVPFLLHIDLKNKDIINQLCVSYRLNPLIQAECSEWSFREKNYVMVFEDCYLVALNDLSIENDLETSVPLRLIVFPDYILSISLEKIYCIEHLFKKTLQFQGYPIEIGLTSNSFNSGVFRSQKFLRDVDIQVESPVQKILYKLLEAIINRYETLVQAVISESNICMCFSTEISYKERADYQQRLANAEINVIKLTHMIKPKLKIIREIRRIYKKDKNYKIYFTALVSRVHRLVSLIKRAEQVLETAKNLYNACAEHAITQNNFSSSEIMKFFSGVSCIVIPLTLVEGFWSMNIAVPGFGDPDFKGFAGIVCVAFCWIVFWVWYFKRIKWF
jgi:Mg2+ and Co2+ transporter CorA